MARPSKFTADQILDGARAAVFDHGTSATVAQAAAKVGAPTGSIYHRFASREVLFGSLWVRSVRWFHIGLLAASEIDDPRAALAAMTRHIPQFCRDHPADAKAMTLYRLVDLLVLWPSDGRDELASLNDDVDTALGRVVRRRYGRATERRLSLARTATRDVPYGLLRPLAGGEIPAVLDDICVAAAEGVLALGDASTSGA